MVRYKWLLSVGCLIPVTALIALAIWIIIAYQNNEKKNEYAKKQFTLLCNEDYLLNNENREKWKKLENDVKSRKIDTRRLSINIENYNGKFDRYKSILGNLYIVNGSNRLFNRKINIYYDKSVIFYLRDLIYINENFFSNFISLGFTARSCYEKNYKYNEIINYHFVDIQK